MPPRDLRFLGAPVAGLALILCNLPARAASTTTIFTAQFPTNASAASSPIEVGVKFRSDSAGMVLGVRFYKLSSANSGAHVGDLWSSSGQLLASAAFTGETASGWQNVLFSTPVAIQANTTYIASYHTTTQYSVTRNYFTGSGVDDPPLHALGSGVDGVNGVYAYGAGPTFPVNGVSDSNWWADVIFQSTAPTSPSIARISPSSATAGGPAFTLTVDGVGFSTRSLVEWNGSSRPTSFVSATELAASISAGDIGSPGTAGVTVFDLQAGASNAVPFVIDPSSGAAFFDAFNYPDGLITNQNPSSPRSPKWLVTRGSLFASGGQGYTGVPDTVSPDATSSNGTGSAVFRAFAQPSSLPSDVSAKVTVSGFPLSGSTTDGVHIYLRYLDANDFYQISIRRRDGRTAIKKKQGGVLTTFTTPLNAPPLGTQVAVRAVAADEPDGSVLLQLFANGTLLASASDASPIKALGQAAMTGENAQFLFDDFTVGGSSAAAPVSSSGTVVSLTFDDGTSTQTVARQILDARGLKGTFYVNSGRVGTDGYLGVSDLRGFATAGHEIAGHTIDHLDLTTLVSSAVVHEVCDDKTQLETWGFRPASFAYPFGATNASVASVVQSCGYKSARGVGGAGCPGCPPAESIPPADVYDLNTVDSVKSTTTLAQLETDVMNAEAAGGGWVIFVMHEISTDTADTFSLSSATLAAFADWLQHRASSGTLVKTVGEVMGAPPVSPAPFLASIAPSSAAAGAPAFRLTAFGMGFSTASVIRWNGAGRATNFISGSTLTASILASDLSSAATASITVSDPSGLSKPLPFTITPSTFSGSTTTIFTTQIPTSFSAASNPIEVGVKFRSDSAGNVIGVRFYKLSSANSGTHTGDLWSSSGQLLASATFTGESASGWQQVFFPAPVAIQANTTYVASYHTTTQYSVTRNYFTSGGVDNAPLHALQSGVDGVNGVYSYGSGPTFPVNGVSDSNWWADVIFQSTGSAGTGTASVASLGPLAPAAVSADPTFAFRDFYVFPNPSRRGQRMTIRLQPGLADTVDVRIYDLSGHLVNSGSVAAPTVLDDGNGKGPQYTYDYPWDVSGAGSGVYLFSVTAHKSGHGPIGKTAKGAVIK